MSLKSAGSLLFRHFEKLCVAGVVVVIAAYVASLAAGTSEAAELKLRAGEAIAGIERARRCAQPPPELNPNFTALVKEPFLNAPPAGRGPVWFAFKRPYVLRRARFIHPPKPVHFPPALTAVTDVSRVTLEWRDSPQNRNAVVQSYELHRRRGAGQWRLLSEFSAGAKSFVDAGLEHEEKYAYRLVSVAAPAAGAAGFARPGDARRESKEQNIETPFNFEVKINIIAEGKAQVEVKERKAGGEFELHTQTWERGTRVVLGGADTGWMVSGIGEDFVEITRPGRRAKRFP